MREANAAEANKDETIENSQDDRKDNDSEDKDHEKSTANDGQSEKPTAESCKENFTCDESLGSQDKYNVVEDSKPESKEEAVKKTNAKATTKEPIKKPSNQRGEMEEAPSDKTETKLNKDSSDKVSMVP